MKATALPTKGGRHVIHVSVSPALKREITAAAWRHRTRESGLIRAAIVAHLLALKSARGASKKPKVQP